MINKVASAKVLSGSCGGRAKWSLDTKTGLLSITGRGQMTDYDLFSHVPWYNYRTDIKSLSIGNQITSIGNYAFAGTSEKPSKLTSVVIPNKVTSIGSYAFFYCSSLESVELGESLETILDYAFARCDLTSVVIPDKVTNIGPAAFRYCTKISNIKFGKSLETIGRYAFAGLGNSAPNTVLNKVIIPDNVITIDSCAFLYCVGLTEVKLGKSLETIGGFAFAGISRKPISVTSLEIPSTVTYIGERAFQYWNGLTSVSFGKSLKTIGGYAFANSSKLEGNISLGKSLQYIGAGAFTSCPAIFTFNSLPRFGSSTITYKANVNLTNDSYICLEGNSIPGNFSSVKYSCNPTNEWGSLILPFEVESSSSVQLYDLEVYVDESHKFMIKKVNSIEANKPFIFKKLTSGETVDFISGNNKVIAPSNVSSEDEESEEEVIVEEGVVSHKFNGFTFNGTYSAKTVESPCYVLSGTEFQKQSNALISPFGVWMNGVNGIDTFFTGDEYGVIYYTSSDKKKIDPASNLFGSVNVLSNSYDSDLNKGTILFDAPVTTIPEAAFRGKSTLISIDLPESVNLLSANSFQNCTSLASFDLPKDITSIPSYCFTNCKKLANIEIPSKVKTINNNSFYGCTSLTEVKFAVGSSLSTIDNYAFSGCDNLSKINLPETVTSIGTHAFLNCKILRNFTIPESVTSIGTKAFSYTGMSTITIPESVTELADYIFEGSNLNTISLPSTLKTIGSNAFMNSGNLQKVVIPNSVTTISSEAFNGCTKLNSVQLPSGLTTISDGLFRECGALVSINLPQQVSTIGVSAFRDCKALKSIALPAAVETINDYAFYNCQDLISLELNSLPKVANTNALQYCHGSLEISFNSNDNTYLYIGGESYLNNYSSMITSASYTRSMNTEWGTAILPYEVSSNDDVQCYKMSGSSDDGLVFTPVKSVAANTPFVFKKKTDASDVTISGNNVVSVATPQYVVNADAPSWKLGGTYEPLAKSGVYFISQDKFWYAQAAPTFKKFRAWLEFNPGGFTPSASALRILVNENEFETSILEIAEDGSVQDATQGIYDLSGHKLSAPVKGQMNIIDGKKVFIK